jgi:ribosome-binding protein aMBF1 (putative translation factor)
MDIATLDQMETKWISPIGRSISDRIAEKERVNPEYRRRREEERPLREVRRAALIRRTELGISQSAMARRLGVSRMVVRRLERCELDFSGEEVRGLAAALDLDLTPFLPAPLDRAA